MTADEQRARHYLQLLGAHPLGHQEPTMTDRPITPARIIPAGAPLPARSPEPGEVPPWREPPPPPPGPPAAPGPIVHRVQVELVFPEPDPDPPGLLSRLWDWLCDWRLLTAVTAAVVPWMAGDSPVTAWAHTLAECRTEAGTTAAYVLAISAAGGAWALDRHTGRWFPRLLLVTAVIGSTGAISLFDPITALTGVSP
ncbi:hypothetical protein [Streptomyces uncialis]|uniref:hypothetical protein n=1 Tax=Streptomyces uncialis TaxID=1048205 RepID=UPI000AD2C9A7|nr:hypothetical protein [Streptomyces uncialis]